MRGVLIMMVTSTAAFAQPASPAPPPPTPEPNWLMHVTMHHGVAFANDSVDDNGASSPGVALGLQVGAQWRFTSSFSLGFGLDATFATHDSDYAADAKATYVHYFMPVLVGRYDLGRFAATWWFGYQRGSRAITQPGGLIDSNVSRDTMNGVVGGGAFVVRVRMPTSYPITAEFGPFVQPTLFAVGDGSVSTVAFGLCAQAVYQGPSI